MWNEDIYNNEVVSMRRLFKEDLLLPEDSLQVLLHLQTDETL